MTQLRKRAEREAGDWEPPISLDADSASACPFPLQVFPEALSTLCRSVAAAVGCPVDYPAAHALGVAAGAIGASYDLQVKRGFYANSNLWICVVAPPGSGKSPAAAPILAPVFAEHSRRRRSADGKLLYVTDVTMEKLAPMLADNPRGLLMAWDEMSGWLTSFNQYKGGRGNDRSHYLSLWDGRPIKVDRKNPESPAVFVYRPRLSVVGGIQPEVLDMLRAGPADGLFDRLLFAFPPDPGLAVETFAEVDEDACAAWERALRDLWGRKMHANHEGDDERPNVIVLTEAGRPVWRGWTEELSERAAAADAAPWTRSVAAKIGGYAVRLALVLHLLREAYGEEAGRGVGEEDMLRAVALASYFLAHADRARRAGGRDKRLVGALAIVSWALGRGEPGFTRPACWESLRNNTVFERFEDLEGPLQLLALHRQVRSVRSGGYELNPLLLRGGRKDARDATQ